jgi:SAM-dependent methyltransferase
VTPSGGLYDNPRIAAGYAFARPPVHQRILEQVRRDLGLTTPVARGLDVGCGAGRSTAALQSLADVAVGVEPAAAMLAHRSAVAPRARFVVGAAEQLPCSTASFDLVTAAGAINYTDRARSLAELARVLRAAGTIVIYDFSAGRRLQGDPALERWYDRFERRYPDAPGYAMDVRGLPFEAAGLALQSFNQLEVPISMTPDSYLAYAMSETRIELALARGEDETAIRGWCQDTLDDVFRGQPRDVIFDGYVAYVRHKSRPI